MGAMERIKVATTADLPKDFCMKEVEFKDQKVLLSKVDGKYYATGSKCSHYGAPLAKGVITSGGRIVCPWHSAAFCAKTGDIEDAPAPNNLQKFQVDLEGEDIYVTADPDLVKQNIRGTKAPMKSGSKVDSNGVVIVGGGPGGAYAVEGLRESGYTGPVKIISKENYLPIDRTKLSKTLMKDAAKLAIRDEAWYKENKIDLSLGVSVTEVDIEKQTVKTDKGDSVSYDHLILATGSTATKLPLDGADLGNIFVLRTIEDTTKINAALDAFTTQQPEIVQKAEEKVGLDKAFKPNMVIIGSSWIGMEAALAGAKKANVTVIGMDQVPFQSILGSEIGNALRKAHEKQGVKFILPAELDKFLPSEKDSKNVGAVLLKSGEKIDADVVLMGAGVKPNTQLFKDIPGIQLDEKDKGIHVDAQLRLKGINKKNVYAVGDIAKFPDIKTGDEMRIEHWNVAGNHARTVANTVMGSEQPYSKTAVFWSAQAGGQLRYVGNSKSSQFEKVHIDGDLEENKWAGYFVKGDEVVAVASMGRDPIVVHASELYTLGKMPSFSAVQGGKNLLEIPLQA